MMRACTINTIHVRAYVVYVCVRARAIKMHSRKATKSILYTKQLAILQFTQFKKCKKECAYIKTYVITYSPLR